jgi:hypothetical protein
MKTFFPPKNIFFNQFASAPIEGDCGKQLVRKVNKKWKLLQNVLLKILVPMYVPNIVLRIQVHIHLCNGHI